MDIQIFNNLRFEYSVGANVIICSIIDTSTNKDVLVSNNVSKILINYSYNNRDYTIEKTLSFHINSVLIFIDNLPAETKINFTPYIIYSQYGLESQVQLTNEIETTTLPYGNIEYEIVEVDPFNDSVIENKIKEVVKYINKLGTYVDDTYDRYAQYAKTIPVKYSSTTQTASAYYYKAYALSKYGLVQTSGGSYADNSTFFHELRHRFGITSPSASHLTRDQLEDRTDMYSFIEDKFTIIHDAVRFETGREDAKVWIFGAHSNIPEGDYTNDGVMNYLAANYIKALAWYTCHDVEDENESKIRIIVPINLKTNSSESSEEDEGNEEPEQIEIDDGINRCYLSNLIKPFIIDNGAKVFLLSNIHHHGYLNKSLNITLYPYEGIANNIYLPNDINSITTFISYDNDFRLQSKLGFDNNTISLINTFDFPGKIHQEDNQYDIKIHGDYKKSNFVDKYANQVTKYYNSFYYEDNISNELEQEDFRDELDIENIRTTGYIIQISNDFDFKEIIYESVINTDNQNDNFIYDFSFSLDNIIDDWNQLNEILVIRSKFIDKRLNVVITSNNVVLTKEWFKYLINDENVNYVKFENQNNLIDNSFMNINTGFNFIDKLNCIIVENKESSELDFKNITKNNTTKIIYKPIFYKVQDLQNLRIRQGVVQNIGINLSEFMNKVDTFILNIGENNFKETSRNDMNVIFNINSNLIEQNSGIYNILDQNFEFISSGNYILY